MEFGWFVDKTAAFCQKRLFDGKGKLWFQWTTSNNQNYLFKQGTLVPVLALLLRLMFYLILGNYWRAKAAGTLKRYYAALNKNHFEQCNGNDSSLIMFQYVSLYSNSDVCS